VQTLLDGVVDYLPSPLDIAATRGHDPDHPEKVLERKPADNEPFSGLAFKIMADSLLPIWCSCVSLRAVENR